MQLALGAVLCEPEDPTRHVWFPTGGFISLDTPQSLDAKGRYARNEGLAGLFAWELSQDDGTLVDAMATAAEGQ